MDWADFSEAMKEASRERRAGNRTNSADILRERGIKFATKNEGAHLIVTHNGMTADFWPGTGKYQVRGKKGYRRGVFNLLAELAKEQK